MLRSLLRDLCITVKPIARTTTVNRLTAIVKKEIFVLREERERKRERGDRDREKRELAKGMQCRHVNRQHARGGPSTGSSKRVAVIG